MIMNYKALSSVVILFLLTNEIIAQAKNTEITSMKKSSVSIQETEAEVSDLQNFIHKKHFDFHFHDLSIDTMQYYKAAYYFTRFNNYRFFDKRRVINFSDRKASIELYSVKEIEMLYGKKLKTFVPKESKLYPEIEFVFSNGMIKEQRIN